MARKKQYYSIYLRATDEPLAIHAPAEQCAKAAGLTLGSFLSVVSRCKTGKVKEGKYEAFLDEEDPHEE